jgi:hypothetical protein
LATLLATFCKLRESDAWPMMSPSKNRRLRVFRNPINAQQVQGATALEHYGAGAYGAGPFGGKTPSEDVPAPPPQMPPGGWFQGQDEATNRVFQEAYRRRNATNTDISWGITPPAGQLSEAGQPPTVELSGEGQVR